MKRQTFEQARLAELPTCLDGPNGQGMARTFGQMQDVEQTVATDAVLLRYPPRGALHPLCPLLNLWPLWKKKD